MLTQRHNLGFTYLLFIRCSAFGPCKTAQNIVDIRTGHVLVEACTSVDNSSAIIAVDLADGCEG